jgi:hypothetical protein
MWDLDEILEQLDELTHDVEEHKRSSASGAA